jgi:prepilin-type N-terminal cleavage/methylation domain-containing protein
MNRKNKAGFTLVELMVVAIIVAILAAVAIPLMSANKARARATEAESALGTVRSALRAMYAETDAYNRDLNGNTIAAGAVIPSVPGIRAGDLDGRWFSDECYTITSISASNYVLRAAGANSTAQQAAEVSTVVITLDQDGDITRAGL